MIRMLNLRGNLFGTCLVTCSFLGACSGKTSDRDLVVLDLAQARVLHDSPNAQFVDPRAPLDFERGHIKGALNLQPAQVSELKTEMEPSVARSKTVVVYGDNPGTGIARAVAKRLMAAGHRGVRLYAGGLDEWRANGLPVDSK